MNKGLLKQEKISGILLVAPAVILMIVWILIPLIYALIISFTNFNLVDIDTNFVGTQNFVNVIKDAKFWLGVRNTITFTVIVVPFQIAIGLFLGFITCSTKKWSGFFRTVFYLPAITSSVTIAAIFTFLFSKYGIVNEFLAIFGFEATTWITDPKFALPFIMIMGVWAGIGFNMLIFISAIQDVPTALYESASIDGAGEVMQFFKITIPMIVNQILFAAIIGIIGAMQIFELAFVASGSSNGSPGGATLTAVMYIYDEAFTKNNLGYASAASFILFVFIFVLSIAQRKIFSERKT